MRDPTPRTLVEGFDWLIVTLMALGAVVAFEPAPFDLLTIALFPVALLLRRLAIPAGSALALACVALFVLANAISLPQARDPEVALRFLAITLYLSLAWLFVLGLSGSMGERTLRVVMLGWTIGAVLTTAATIASYFGLLPFGALMHSTGRVNGLFKDPNVLGAYLVAPALWSASRLVSLERGGRLPWALALAVCGTGILLTYSRGAWISLGVAFTLFFGLRMVGRGSSRARLMTMLALPVAALLLALAIDRLADIGVVQDMLEQRLRRQAYDTDRFATQREALAIAIEHPWGIGPGQSERAFTRAAHNTYVRSLVENGYLGGLAMTALLVSSLFRATWQALSATSSRYQVGMAVVAASLAAIVVESAVIDSVHWRHLWVLSALAWTPALGLGRHTRRGET